MSANQAHHQNPVTAMDVDSPTGVLLKRCSSAPTINDNAGNATMTTSPTGNPTQSSFTRNHLQLVKTKPQDISSSLVILKVAGEQLNLFSNTNQFRMRRFSASSCTPMCGSPNSGLRLTPRINQLRQEECVDNCNMREVAHEREIHSTMQISQSWEDLRLVADTPNDTKMMPLHVNLPSYPMPISNSPSPTRVGSPGFQSPKRCTLVRRSASPSPILRASSLGVKRKLDDDKLDYHLSPRSKRLHSYDHSGLLTTSSPLPGSISSVGTPDSSSSADSPGFNMSPSPVRPLISEMSKSDQDMADSNS